jgi:hypothetical protein
MPAVIALFGRYMVPATDTMNTTFYTQLSQSGSMAFVRRFRSQTEATCQGVTSPGAH